MVAIDIVGAENLLRRLSDMPREVQERVGHATQATAHEVQALARQLAPKDTGRLANSITVRETGPLTWEVFTNVEYARRQEFGFVGTDRLGRTYNQPGRYYMTIAMDTAKDAFTKRVRDAIREAL
jgi:phage gpG-like protein